MGHRVDLANVPCASWQSSALPRVSGLQAGALHHAVIRALHHVIAQALGLRCLPQLANQVELRPTVMIF